MNLYTAAHFEWTCVVWSALGAFSASSYLVFHIISVKNIVFKAHIVKDSEGLLDVYRHKLLVNLGNFAAIIVHEFKTIPAIALFALKTLAERDISVLRFHKYWQTVRSSL